MFRQVSENVAIAVHKRFSGLDLLAHSQILGGERISAGGFDREDFFALLASLGLEWKLMIWAEEF